MDHCTSHAAIQTLHDFAPWVVLSASFLGSLHCIGMCGGLVVATARSPMAMTTYHAMRLLGYVALGYLAGHIGESIQNIPQGLPAKLAGIMLGLFFISWGIGIGFKRVIHIPHPHFIGSFHRMITATRRPHLIAAATGLLSIFLPCGWLYSIVLMAGTTQRPIEAMTLMALFWLGTVPALTFAPSILQRLLRPLSQTSPYWVSALFIMVGLGTLILKFS